MFTLNDARRDKIHTCSRTDVEGKSVDTTIQKSLNFLRMATTVSISLLMTMPGAIIDALAAISNSDDGEAISERFNSFVIDIIDRIDAKMEK